MLSSELHKIVITCACTAASFMLVINATQSKRSDLTVDRGRMQPNKLTFSKNCSSFDRLVGLLAVALKSGSSAAHMNDQHSLVQPLCNPVKLQLGVPCLRP